MAYGRADFLVAAASTKLSARCLLTLRPLAIATSAQIDTSFKANRTFSLATTLLEQQKYAGKLVVICWTHLRLPALARALHAANGEFPDPWGESVFNLTLQLDYKTNGKPKVVEKLQPF